MEFIVDNFKSIRQMTAYFEFPFAPEAFWRTATADVIGKVTEYQSIRVIFPHHFLFSKSLPAVLISQSERNFMLQWQSKHILLPVRKKMLSKVVSIFAVEKTMWVVLFKASVFPKALPPTVNADTRPVNKMLKMISLRPGQASTRLIIITAATTPLTIPRISPTTSLQKLATRSAFLTRYIPFFAP